MMKLSMCGMLPSTTGHKELIAIADLLATEVLNGAAKDRIKDLARCYQNMRIEANIQVHRRG